MISIVEAVREVLGFPMLSEDMNSYEYLVACFEYIISGLLLLIVVASVFKLILNWSK